MNEIANVDIPSNVELSPPIAVIKWTATEFDKIVAARMFKEVVYNGGEIRSFGRASKTGAVMEVEIAYSGNAPLLKAVEILLQEGATKIEILS